MVHYGSFIPAWLIEIRGNDTRHVICGVLMIVCFCFFRGVVVGAAERIIRGVANMILTMILIRHYSFFFHALVFLVVRVIRAKEEESSLCFGGSLAQSRRKQSV